MSPQLVILVNLLHSTACIFADLPKGTRPGRKDLVTEKMLKNSGKDYLMVLDVDSTILIRLEPHLEEIDGMRKTVCPRPSFTLSVDAEGTILECGVMRPGFMQFIVKANEKFFLIIYTANSLDKAKAIGRMLEDMYPGTKFEVRASPHIHTYPENRKMDGGGSKDLRNIMEKKLIPFAVILEDDPKWYTNLPRKPNQLLCLIQVPKLIFNWKEAEKVAEVYYHDTTLPNVRALLDPILNPTTVGTPKTLREVLDKERVRQMRADTDEMWIFVD